MREPVCQGDLIRIEHIKTPVLVMSKNFFNQSGEVIGCPVLKNGQAGALHIYVKTKEVEGFVQCEKMKLLDLNIRGYHKIDRITMADVINITDAIQGIFDYV